MAIAFAKKDTLLIGIVLGIVVPVLIAGVHYYNKTGGHLPVSDYVQLLKTDKGFLSGLTTLFLVANGILFGLLIQFKKFQIAKGVFIPTVIIGILTLLYKLL